MKAGHTGHPHATALPLSRETRNGALLKMRVRGLSALSLLQRNNPPRIAPRNLFDASVGHDNLFHGDRYKWSLRFTVINLTNKLALYNFLSTFSGTHYVTPRAVTAEVGFHF